MSSITSHPSKPRVDPPHKPLKLMSQQEKLAWKAAQEKKAPNAKDTPTNQNNSKPNKKDDKDTKKKKQYLSPSTPPSELGSSLRDDGGNSPASQACTSGTVTPTSEGVRRADRKEMHAPPGGLDL